MENNIIDANSLNLESSEDEDVILPNSPLSNYVEGLNLSEDGLNQNESETDVVEEPNPNTFHSEFRNSANGGSSFSAKVLDFIDTVYSVFLAHVFVLEHSVLRNRLESAEAVSLLIDEDRTFTQKWNMDNMTNRLKSLVFRILCMTTVLTIAIFTIRFNITNIKSDISFLDAIVFDFHTIMHMYPSVVSFLILVFYFIELSHFFLIWYRFNYLLCNMNVLYSHIKKCIRLIQEAELVARGFTTASVRSLAEKIELSPSLPITSSRRQYMELRKYVFAWTKDIFMEYRSSTNTLIDRISQDIELDFTSNYLAKLDIKEFGIILQYDMNLDSEYQELLRVTDNFSISSLKTMFDLMELQVSEFFKCLYLASSVYAENKSKNKGLLQTIESSERRTELSILCVKMSYLLDRVDKKYKYYRCCEAMNLSSDDLKPPEYSDRSDLVVTIHNMSLHLKAALWRLIEIEDKFSDKSLTSNNWKDKSFMKEISTLLEIVKSEVSGYEEHLIKCNNFLDEFSGSKTPSASSKICIVENQERKCNSSTIPSKRCDAENDIQDEVFEDVISRNILDGEESGDKTFHQEECQKNLKLLKELKNVLIIKADEHHAREQIALAKKQKVSGMTDCESNFKENNDLSNSIDLCQDHPKEPRCLQIKEEDNCPQELDLDNEEFKGKLGFLLEQKGTNSNSMLQSNDSFAAAIAKMAAFQRGQSGLSTEEFEYGSSDDDDMSN